MKKIIAAFVLCLCMIMMAACGGSGGSSDSSSILENPGNVYRVVTVDESGAPGEGVALQFCSDQLCQMGKTDADGIAVFEDEEGTYTVHVYKVPEGYAEDNTEYPVPEQYGDVNITIKAAQ
ncbi:MAG: hypothetical protein E7220_06200 [Clostridiales bacterium]|nr:hypothetical protein [Clostridiales bacterium]